MQLGDGLISKIEGEGQIFVPPYPHRRTEKAGTLKLVRLFRDNIIATYSEMDFTRDVISYRFLNRDVFTVNDPELIHSTFTAQHDVFQRKTPQMRTALTPLLGDGLFVSDGATWKLRRGIVNQIVHGSRVAGFSHIMCETAGEWRDTWAQQPDGAQIDALSEMAQLTAEIITRTIFGNRLGRAHTADLVRGFTAYQDRINQLDLASMAGLPDWFPRFHGRGMGAALRRVRKVIDHIIDGFAAGKGDANAVIAQLFAAKDDEGRPLSREAIRNEAIVIFMAGHETTANTLAWAWYLISQCPRSRRKFHEEIDTELDGRAPTIADMPKLRQTRAIIDETLRLYPPVPILGRQAIAEGRIGDLTVTPGALVLVSPWLLHRKAAIWSKPDGFLPERFDERLATRPTKYSYVPFAIGPRICPGLTFGIAEAVLCLATLAQNFDLSLAPGHRVETACRLTLRPGEHLPMTLNRRAA